MRIFLTTLWALSLLMLLLLLCDPAKEPFSDFDAWSGKVVYVADGDTFDVEKDGKKIRVRLYGVATPESAQAFGQNAMAFTSSQVMGKMVDVQKIDVDRYGRIVGIVSVGNLALNRHLVEYGYAMVYDAYCKKPFCSEWTKAEAVARKAKRGLWKNPEPIPPWEYRRSKKGKSSKAKAKTPVASGSECDCSGNRYNCSYFKTQAQACYDRCRRVKGRDVHKLDGDSRVCEGLR